MNEKEMKTERLGEIKKIVAPYIEEMKEIEKWLKDNCESGERVLAIHWQSLVSEVDSLCCGERAFVHVTLVPGSRSNAPARE